MAIFPLIHFFFFFFSFFEEAKRIASPDYIPNVDDVLRARTKTTGIYETRFTMGQLSIQYATSDLPSTIGEFPILILV